MKTSLAVLFALSMFVPFASHADWNGLGHHERRLASDRLSADEADEPKLPEPDGALAFAVGLVTIYGASSVRRRNAAD